MGAFNSDLVLKLLVYCSILGVVFFRPKNIIYLLVLCAPFYEIFPPLYIKTHIAEIGMTIKPFFLVEIILIFFVLFDFIRNGIDLKSVPRDQRFMVLSFAVFCGLSFLFTATTEAQEGGRRFTELNMMINVALLFCLPYFYRLKKIDVSKMLAGFSLSLLFVITFFTMYPGEVGREEMFFMQMVATFLSMTAPIISAGILFYNKSRDNILYGTSFIVLIIMLSLTVSKSAWLGFIFPYSTFIVCAWILLAKEKKLDRRKFYFIFCSIAICIAAFFISNQVIRDEILGVANLAQTEKVYNMEDPALREIQNIYVRNAYYIIGHQRTILWREAFQQFMRSPFRGYGLNYIVVAGMQGVHNSYVRVLAASGLLGSISFIGAVYLLVKTVLQKIFISLDWRKKLFFIAILCSIFSWLIQGIFQTVLNDYIIWMVLALALLNPDSLCFENNNEK